MGACRALGMEILDGITLCVLSKQLVMNGNTQGSMNSFEAYRIALQKLITREGLSILSGTFMKNYSNPYFSTI